MSLWKRWFQNRKRRADQVDLQSRFELLAEMGLGTMSKVWKAQDRLRDRTVALKIIDRVQQERINAKFPRVQRPSEGEVSVSLTHPHIVKTYEFGESTQGEPFLVMEFIEGVGLQKLIETRHEALSKQALKWAVQMGEGLTYFHARNFIHRDFCPKNILIAQKGGVKLIDFGLVVPNTPPFQAPGNRTGTADYMAPELVKRQRTDQRIDVYSYAVTCYEMFTGQLPFPSGKSIETIVKNLNRPPRDPRELAPDLPEELVQVILRGLEKRPEDRWQTSQEMTQALKGLGPRG